MALIDLLNPENNSTFNYKLANILGLEASIYLSRVISINQKAIKKKLIYNNFFKIDRAYITEKTTLKVSKQKEIEKNLAELNIIVINKDDADLISLNLSVLISIFNDNNEEVKKEVKRVAGQTKETKKLAIARALKNHIDTPNDEIREAYYNWIDTVVQTKSMNVTTVESAQKILRKFTSDAKVALEIINIATANSYMDLTFAINNYTRLMNVMAKETSNAQSTVVSTRAQGFNRHSEEF